MGRREDAMPISAGHHGTGAFRCFCLTRRPAQVSNRRGINSYMLLGFRRHGGRVFEVNFSASPVGRPFRIALVGGNLDLGDLHSAVGRFFPQPGLVRREAFALSGRSGPRCVPW